MSLLSVLTFLLLIVSRVRSMSTFKTNVTFIHVDVPDGKLLDNRACAKNLCSLSVSACFEALDTLFPKPDTCAGTWSDSQALNNIQTKFIFAVNKTYGNLKNPTPVSLTTNNNTGFLLKFKIYQTGGNVLLIDNFVVTVTKDSDDVIDYFSYRPKTDSSTNLKFSWVNPFPKPPTTKIPEVTPSSIASSSTSKSSLQPATSETKLITDQPTSNSHSTPDISTATLGKLSTAGSTRVEAGETTWTKFVIDEATTNVSSSGSSTTSKTSTSTKHSQKTTTEADKISNTGSTYHASSLDWTSQPSSTDATPKTSIIFPSTSKSTYIASSTTRGTPSLSTATTAKPSSSVTTTNVKSSSSSTTTTSLASTTKSSTSTTKSSTSTTKSSTSTTKSSTSTSKSSASSKQSSVSTKQSTTPTKQFSTKVATSPSKSTISTTKSNIFTPPIIHFPGSSSNKVRLSLLVLVARCLFALLSM